MRQFITYNNLNDTDLSRRYAGFPLNSTLVSSYTADTIRSIINHAVTGKPYSMLNKIYFLIFINTILFS